ncbi:MAG: DNA primase [Candidatus Saccharibacteria bacterium]|nr:DNA primase [Candidatus Saccharibacteria bacterium]
MQDAKEDIRSRINIEDVIGEYVRLQRAGRSFKGLSPFNDEKTPSFMVSPDKHVWYDFSSNQGGDIYSFIMQVEGLDFRGAMELLARKAGVDLSMYQAADKGLGKKKERLYELLEAASHYYQQTLVKNQHALEYVTKTRKLNKKVIQDFKIGYAPNAIDSIVTFLRKKGFKDSEIKDAGMMNRAGKDLFRSRLMLALQDASGQVIGFTGRLIANDPKAPKYLNTPQTLLYDKSRHVYGLHLAKDAIRKQDKAVIVEGNVDVISSHQAGIHNVVATAGTAMTEQHLKIIKRLSSNITLAFDNDRAGLAATERAIEMSQQLGIELTIISLPEEHKDPDELIQHDPELWKDAIKTAKPVVDWVLAEYEKRYDISTAEGKRHYSSAGLNIIGKLRDSIESEHYMKIIADKTGVSLDAVKSKLHSFSQPDDQVLKKINVERPKATSTERKNQDKLLAIAVMDPKVRGLLIEMNPDDFEADQQKALLQYMKTMPDIDLSGDIPDSLQELDTYVKVLLLRADERYKQWGEIDRYDETAKLVRLVKNQTREYKKRQLNEALKQAEVAGDKKAKEKLVVELNEIIKES